MIPGRTYQRPTPPRAQPRIKAAPKDITLLVPSGPLAEIDQKYILVVPKSESTNEVQA